MGLSGVENKGNTAYSEVDFSDNAKDIVISGHCRMRQRSHGSGYNKKPSYKEPCTRVYHFLGAWFSLLFCFSSLYPAELPTSDSSCSFATRSNSAMQFSRPQIYLPSGNDLLKWGLARPFHFCVCSIHLAKLFGFKARANALSRLLLWAELETMV